MILSGHPQIELTPEEVTGWVDKGYWVILKVESPVTVRVVLLGSPLVHSTYIEYSSFIFKFELGIVEFT